MHVLRVGVVPVVVIMPAMVVVAMRHFRFFRLAVFFGLLRRFRLHFFRDFLRRVFLGVFLGVLGRFLRRFFRSFLRGLLRGFLGSRRLLLLHVLRDLDERFFGDVLCRLLRRRLGFCLGPDLGFCLGFDLGFSFGLGGRYRLRRGCILHG